MLSSYYVLTMYLLRPYYVQRDLVGSAVALGAILSGLLVALATGLWAKANFGDDAPLW